MVKRINLTSKQRRFINSYLLNPNATNAAKDAGYSARTAHVQGCRLLTNVKVKERIEKAFAEEANISKSEFINLCQNEFKTSEAKSDRARFLDLTGRALGYLKSGDVTINTVQVVDKDSVDERRKSWQLNKLDTSKSIDSNIT